jgi:hypothetical protein
MQSQKQQRKQTLNQLLELGYKADSVALALKESKNKSLEECLDLLLFKEEEYSLLSECKSRPKLDQSSASAGVGLTSLEKSKSAAPKFQKSTTTTKQQQ